MPQLLVSSINDTTICNNRKCSMVMKRTKSSMLQIIFSNNNSEIVPFVYNLQLVLRQAGKESTKSMLPLAFVGA